MIAVSFVDRSIDALLAARLAGEAVSLVATLFMARQAPRSGRYSFTLSTVVGALFFGLACLVCFALGAAADRLWPSALATVAFCLVVLAWGAVDLRRRIGRLRGAIARDDGALGTSVQPL
jgi:hypothetical protein